VGRVDDEGQAHGEPVAEAPAGEVPRRAARPETAGKEPIAMRGIRGLWGVVLLALTMTAVPVVAAEVTVEEPTDGGEIAVLSNRADLVSDGDALVEVRWPAGTDPAAITVAVDGRDVSDAFALRGDDRYLGRLKGLVDGPNVVTARFADGSGAQLVVTNHPRSGPIFSGPHLQPWRCTTASNGLGDPVDEHCNAETRYELLYRSGSGFAPYDPDNPPASVPTITTDEGKEVPYIIRQETGTANRGIYRIAVLYDPAEPFAPWDNDAQGWNGKLYYPFGASCGTQHSQGSAQNVQNHDALSRGFMVATSSLNVTGSNCNTVLQAETMMMLKERIVDRYGEIRFTFGTGSSGGAIGQHMVANAYPGLLQGLTVGAAYADTISTGAEVFDCHNLVRYFTRTSPHLWVNVAQQNAVMGHGTSPATCVGWELLFTSTLDPTTGCGLPAEETYHPEDNPDGARCTSQDFERNVFGLRGPERWTPMEQAVDRGFANQLYGNEGVQYGLNALQRGLITTEQFVDLNEKIGGFDVDRHPTATRAKADPGAAANVYRGGRINDGAHLDEVAIIDFRGLGNIDPLLIHTMHHSFALKERIARIHGHADNHVVWRGTAPWSAFDVMDAWLTAVEADGSDAPLAEKIVANRPSEARDACFAARQEITDEGLCDLVWPYYGAPRTVAGMSMAHDVFECTLRPLSRRDDYGPLPFTDAQWERLERTFPDGVCDWAVPGVGQEHRTVPWMTYEDGPGLGRPLGPPPTSTAL
jgi:hypothetical protein